MTTKIGIEFLTAEVANTITAAASAFDTIGANNQVLTSNGSALVWAEPSGGSGAGVTAYANVASLPASGVDEGALAYVRANSTLYAYVDDEWIAATSRSTNTFYILQTDSFTAPITGNVAFTPSRNIQLTSIDLYASANVSTNLVVSVRKNSTELQQFTILANDRESSGDFSNNQILTTDSVFIDITSGSGNDLVARFFYI